MKYNESNQLQEVRAYKLNQYDIFMSNIFKINYSLEETQNHRITYTIKNNLLSKAEEESSFIVRPIYMENEFVYFIVCKSEEKDIIDIGKENIIINEYFRNKN